MKKKTVIAIVILLVIYGLILFFGAPNLNPLYSDGLAFWAFLITVTVFVVWLMKNAGRAKSFVHDGRVNIPRGSLKLRSLWIAVAAAPWVILIVVNIGSAVLFHSPRYRDQLGSPQKRVFTSDLQPIDVSQLPVVDQSLAANLADKELGEKPALGSQVTLGDPTIQKVDGKLVWVVPLEDSGFFKWLSQLGGTPGYIVISATNPNDVKYVGNYPIKYQPNAYLMDNLARYARFGGGLFRGLTDYSFEIDDTGRPYWVLTTYKNTVGFSLPEANGVQIIDAGTGKSKWYSIADVPAWVDRVQPADFIMNQINNQGQYVHGIFNFSNKDKFEAAGGYAIVYNKNRCYLFTDLTSVGSDESVIGFLMVDMVTKKVNLYQMSGATEYAAQQSAQGKFQNYQYTASFPLITNVDGQPTYFMTLKDNAGLIKQYAFVSVQSYSTLGSGQTIQDAINDYEGALESAGGGSAIQTGNKTLTLEGTVERIAPEQESGNTVYMFILSGKPDVIFTASYDLNKELSLTREGDKVKVTYVDSKGPIEQANSFDNESIGVQ